MRINFEDDFMDSMGNEASNQTHLLNVQQTNQNAQKEDFISLEKVIYRAGKVDTLTNFPYVIYVLPVSDYGKEKYIL